MKTRKVEIEEWVAVQRGNPVLYNIYESKRECEEGISEDYMCVPCKISFEVPVPERKVEITESMIDGAIVAMWENRGAIHKDQMAPFLKSYFFKEES